MRQTTTPLQNAAVRASLPHFNNVKERISQGGSPKRSRAYKPRLRRSQQPFAKLSPGILANAASLQQRPALDPDSALARGCDPFVAAMSFISHIK